MLTLDLPPSVEQSLIRSAYAKDMSVSNYILQYLPVPVTDEANLAWQHGKDLFGCWDSGGDGTLSQNVKSQVAQAVRAKWQKS